MRDDETESYRQEQGKPARADPRDRQAEVPIAFSTGGMLASGADDARTPGDDDGRIAESADATAAIERGAAAIAAERRAGRRDDAAAAADASDQARPSARS